MVNIPNFSCICDKAESAGEEFAEQLDKGHRVTCPWRGNSCPESLVQFPPTPPSALIGGFKDRFDGLLQFYCLPIVSSSAIEMMRASRGSQIDRLLLQSQIYTSGELGYKAESAAGMEPNREEDFFIFSRVCFQKLNTDTEILLLLCPY